LLTRPICAALYTELPLQRAQTVSDSRINGVFPARYYRSSPRGLTRRQEAVRACKSFPELIDISEKVAGRIWKNSEVTVYDTACRVGAYLGIEPKLVYLHAGVRKGAKALGFKGSLPFISPSKLPKEFRKLKPDEIENCLCIYRDALKRLRKELA